MLKLHLTCMRPDACNLINQAAWTLYFLIAVLLAVLLAGCGSDSSPTNLVDQGSLAAETSTTESSPILGSVTVEIVIDPAAASNSTQTVEMSAGTTLEMVMASLEGVEVEISGKGVTAFVQSINGVGPSADRGWTYTLDGEFATKGIGSTMLRPGQTVQWKFTMFEEAMK